jgi:hypothetical protein
VAVLVAVEVTAAQALLEVLELLDKEMPEVLAQLLFTAATAVALVRQVALGQAAQVLAVV